MTAQSTSPAWLLPEVPVLRDWGKPRVTVRVPGRAWEDLQNLAREASDGRETGGFFFGPFVRSHAPVRVDWVERMVKERHEDRLTPDWQALEYERRRDHGDIGVEVQGMWHTHPDGVALPSEADMRAWLCELDRSERWAYVGLILTAASTTSAGGVRTFTAGS